MSDAYKEAIRELTALDGVGTTQLDGKTEVVFSHDFAKALELAVSVLKEKESQKTSRPLTLSEVRQSSGALWICYPQETWGPQAVDAESLSCSQYKFSFKNYGKTWVAYKDNPWEA